MRNLPLRLIPGMKILASASLIVILLGGIVLHTKAGTLIETYGHYAPSDAPWLVDVSSGSITLGHGAVDGTASSNSAGPLKLKIKSHITAAVSPKWTAHAGWFVFVESPQKIWAYDGAESLLFDETTPHDGVTSQLEKSFDTIPEMPPEAVFVKLPEKMQEALRARFPAGH
jgi:hypothetical protein